jgi:hypothetical protein
VASQVEMLSGKRKKDYAAESAAQALEAQAAAMGFVPQNDDEATELGDEISDEIGSEEEELVAA